MSKRNRMYRQQLAKVTPKRNNSADMLDIVIPVYGAFDLLASCLPLLEKAVGPFPYKIKLVDNFSPDQAEADVFYEGVAKQYPNATVFRLKENRGFGAACNYGEEHGKAKYVLFLNSDAFMLENSIRFMIDDMERDPSIGLIGPKLLFPKNTPHGPEGMVQHAGLNFNIRAGIDHTFIGWHPDHPKVNVMCEVDALTGTCILTKRDIFDRAGKFYLGYGLGTWEDVDLALTIRELGYNIIYEPKAVGFHYVGGSVTKYKMAYPLQQNQQLFQLRWGSRIPWTVWRRL